MAGNGTYDLGRPLRALDAWDCRLNAPATASSDGKEPFLYWDFRYHKDGKVRDIELGINLRKQGRDGKITFFPNLTQFKMLCISIEDIALGRVVDDNGQLINVVKMEAMTTFMFGKKLDRPEVEIMLVVGKDDEGIFLGVSQKGRDNVKFHFKPPKMTQFRLASGEVVTNGYISSLAARARADLWQGHIEYHLKVGYLSDAELQQAKDAKQQANQARFSQKQGGGGGGGNWNNNRNNNSGGGQSSSYTPPSTPIDGGGAGHDDDIPW